MFSCGGMVLLCEVESQTVEGGIRTGSSGEDICKYRSL